MEILARELSRMFGGRVSINGKHFIPLDELERGDGVIVRFGSHGTQPAMIYDRTKAGNVRAFKYSARSGKWKGPIRLHEGEVIRRGSTADFHDLPLTPDAYRKGAQSKARGAVGWVPFKR